MDFERFEFKLLVALLLGALIGLERQLRNQNAGVRTNALVSLGSALFVVLSEKLSGDLTAEARIISQIVTGIGFLGAGVIMKDRENVSGLNTAATVWCSGAVGVLSGMGFWYESVVGTGFVLLSHVMLRPITKKIESKRGRTIYDLRFVVNEAMENSLRHRILKELEAIPKLKIKGMESDEEAIQHRIAFRLKVIVLGEQKEKLEEVVNVLREDPEIYAVSWER